MTFGVQPERAATEYGYISPGEVISGAVRCGREVRRKAGSGDGRRLHQGRAISGTAAISCFAPPFCSTNTATSMPASVQAVSDAVAKAGRDLGFVTLDADAFG